MVATPAARTHRCPGGCGQQVPQHLYACKPDWFRLPLKIRTEIWKTYRRNDAGGHLAAMSEAARWYDNNKLERLL